MLLLPMQLFLRQSQFGLKRERKKKEKKGFQNENDLKIILIDLLNGKQNHSGQAARGPGAHQHAGLKTKF